MDLARCYLHLVPDAKFATTNNDHALTFWAGPGPMPSLAECEAAWVAVQAMEAAEARNAGIRSQLDALDARYGVRAITEAMDGDPARLEWLKAEKERLRAQFV
jgi:hypothetical protein